VVSCCLSATGVRFSGHPNPTRGVAPFSRSAYRTPNTATDPVGVSTFHTHESRPGWAPSLPRGRRCSPWTGCRARPAPAASQRHVPALRYHTHHGATIHEASTKVHAIHPSGLPLTRDLPVGQEILWLSPRATHPAVTNNARQGRPGHSTSPELHHQYHLGPPISELTRKVRPGVATADPNARGCPLKRLMRFADGRQT
jgi:hypothetical protein